MNTCMICNCCLYARSVLRFHQDKDDMILTKLFVILHSGSIFTCDRYLNKKNLPSQVACNKLNIPSVPCELKHINRCKHVLVCRRLLFQKVIIMRKAYFPKLKGVICNIPVVTTGIVNVVQRGVHSNSRIFAKLKLKLSMRISRLFHQK